MPPKGARLKIGGVTRSTHEIESHFKRFGYIDAIEFKSGYSFIEYTTRSDAQDAINDMNKKIIEGKEISVEWADKRRSRSPEATKLKLPTYERIPRV